ncbi:hypothetical protein ACH4S8_04330 [Streptomyces sp. NPDC021080]|uniref:hypothetical protein n=1 Tax=Streptomyces sp. NPDC021080 TaxID=3365110 RepID=UPI003795C4FF
MHRGPETAREQVNTYLLDNYHGRLSDFVAAVSTDGTATSSTVKAADLSDGDLIDAHSPTSPADTSTMATPAHPSTRPTDPTA